MKTYFRLNLAAAIGTLAFAAPATAQIAPVQTAETEAGHRLGSETAPVELVEFFSYTCPHCGEFARSEGALHVGYIGTQAVRAEYVPVIRNPVDLVMTMLVDCGDPQKFLSNHNRVMFRQSEWLPIAANATDAQKALWNQAGRSVDARREIARALDIYSMFTENGYERIELDRCLADQAAAERIFSGSRQTAASYGVQSTPSFVLNGQLLEGTHSWPALETILRAAISEDTAEEILPGGLLPDQEYEDRLTQPE